MVRVRCLPESPKLGLSGRRRAGPLKPAVGQPLWPSDPPSCSLFPVRAKSRIGRLRSPPCTGLTACPAGSSFGLLLDLGPRVGGSHAPISRPRGYPSWAGRPVCRQSHSHPACPSAARARQPTRPGVDRRYLRRGESGRGRGGRRLGDWPRRDLGPFSEARRWRNWDGAAPPAGTRCKNTLRDTQHSCSATRDVDRDQLTAGPRTRILARCRAGAARFEAFRRLQSR